MFATAHGGRDLSPRLESGHSATLTWRTLSACRDRTHAVAAGVARGFPRASLAGNIARPPTALVMVSKRRAHSTRETQMAAPSNDADPPTLTVRLVATNPPGGGATPEAHGSVPYSNGGTMKLIW